MRHVSRLLAFTLIAAIFSSVFAGEITLKNGDRLSGRIVEESEDAVVIETEYAGKLKIDRKHIAKVGSALPARAAAAANLAAPKPVAAAAPPPVGTVIKKSSRNGFVGRMRSIATGWDGNANIGFSYTSGNSNNITMTTGLRASKSRPQDGITIYARSLWNSNHGSNLNVTTQNAFWGGARYDRTLNKKVFGFVSYDFERDKPRRLDFRSVAGGGLGHRTIKNDRTELELFMGGAWNRTWQANSDANTPEGLAGFNFKHRINDKLRIQNAVTYFQNVTDRVEFRFIMDSTISIDVTKKIGFFIAVGDRYNNDPNGTSKKNDFLLTTGMKWNFGKKK
jgi:putative salt-induced outer membrane protein YdiY